jgi:oxygen-independent coproporphyrinogen-3 oxidase
VPDEEATADFYVAACEGLEAAGVTQYEISNFARAGVDSRHNLKYWTRQPYVGFGVDAHSMLASASPEAEAVRFATADVLEKLFAGAPLQRTVVSPAMAFEESFFLGLRLNRGVNLLGIGVTFGQQAVHNALAAIEELISDGLLRRDADFIRLTPRGRLLSNEVFERFITPADVATKA